MNQPRHSTSRHPRRRLGFTLIELLITITILGVLAAIVIPTVRILNSDRKVREAARIVGSVFAAAREQAGLDGMAGVEIVHNSNDSLHNMGLTLYRLRSIPPYIGDTFGATATVAGTVATLDMTNDAMAAGVVDRDYIEFNDSGVWYQIDGDPSATTIDFIVGPADPPPPNGIDIPFRVWRQPVRIKSSETKLPTRFFINMAFSGQGVSGNQFLQYHPDDYLPATVTSEPSTKIWFNRNGSIDRVTDRDPGPPPTQPSSTMTPSSGSLYLLICSGEGDDVDLTDLQNIQFLENDDNLWVVIEGNSGVVTVGRMSNITQSASTIAEKITDARKLARNRQSANP